MNVWVLQAPKEAQALRLVPHFDLPRKWVTFVLTLVSSIMTTRCGGLRDGWARPADPVVPCFLYMGFAPFVRDEAFFAREIKAPQHDMNAGQRGLYAMGFKYGGLQLLQGDFRICSTNFAKKPS